VKQLHAARHAVEAHLIRGFLLSHGIPAETARTKPYWGDGTADPLQWLGVGLIWTCCATVAVFARQLPKQARNGRGTRFIRSGR